MRKSPTMTSRKMSPPLRAPLHAQSANLPQRNRLPARAVASPPVPESLRTRLIEEGRKMFEENGASELSLRELARRLGVSEAAPSKHFTGKEELLASIAITGFEEVAQERMRIDALDLSPVKKAREMMLSYVRYARTHPGLFHLMTGPRLLEEFVRGDIEATSNFSYGFFAKSIYELASASGWTKKQLEPLAHAAWSVEHGLAMLLLAGRSPRIDSSLEPEAMVDFSINLLLSAIVAGPEAFGKVLETLKR